MSLAKTLLFTGPRATRVESNPIPKPGEDQLLIETTFSAISAGTELLVYRDQFPPSLSIDGTLDQYADQFSYPLTYGYTVVGRIKDSGSKENQAVVGKNVFAFQPHHSHFVAKKEDLIFLPDHFDPKQALFIPNLETAVNLVQDGAPLLGERVLVIGLGIVGQLVTTLLSRFPLAQLTAIDYLPLRRKMVEQTSVVQALHPDDLIGEDQYDLIFELSGSPAALDTAIEKALYTGRIVVGSWYGQKRSPIDLGGHFHRNRIGIISSQVSTIAPNLAGRWDKERRFDTVLKTLTTLNSEPWITHQFSIDNAAEAYRLIDQKPEETLQVIFSY